MSGEIKKILIANRGEIALRVIRTCREMGVGTVAVYSDVDENAPFVRSAGEAYPLHGITAGETYLDQTKIIAAAKVSGSDAIHPGYGFLSENEDFAELVVQNGITFIGPPPEVIRTLGDKLAARKLAGSLGVQIISGSAEPLSSTDTIGKIAAQVGYPVLLKAAGGGGGKGMRIVSDQKELESSFRSATSEALAAFGDDRIYIEKYIGNPRHIEVQILADRFGNVVHLGERECSIQRRHQKIIEESPSAIVDQSLRADITNAAIRICKESGYINAGTVEFLLDEKKNFYFLEVNTRLQVEHPVTEMCTGIDLVREQILIAQGEHLRISQDQIKFQGHAIECRIYAEDPSNSFFPSTGTIVHLQSPAGPFVREDRGIIEGDVVTPFYDPLLSKLIAWGPTRKDAIARMKMALNEFELFGVKNNLSLCLWIMDEPHFRSGDFSTNYLSREFDAKKHLEIPKTLIETAILSAVVMSSEQNKRNPHSKISNDMVSGWRRKREGSMR